MAASFYKRVCSILDSENVKYDAKAVAGVITKHFPDFRRVLNELQRYSATGYIDTGILTNISDDNINKLVGFIKEKNFTEVRKWVSMNNDIEYSTFFRKLYDMASAIMVPNSIPVLVLKLADYQYKAAFVADQEINTAALLTELMVECEFK